MTIPGLQLVVNLKEGSSISFDTLEELQTFAKIFEEKEILTPKLPILERHIFEDISEEPRLQEMYEKVMQRLPDENTREAWDTLFGAKEDVSAITLCNQLGLSKRQALGRGVMWPIQKAIEEAGYPAEVLQVNKVRDNKARTVTSYYRVQMLARNGTHAEIWQ